LNGTSLKKVEAQDFGALARAITLAEQALTDPKRPPRTICRKRSTTGSVSARFRSSGSRGPVAPGKSSFTDELVRRYLDDFETHRVAVLSVDPTRKKTGGALLGDRIRMNAIHSERCFMRSLATRGAKGELSLAIQDAIKLCKAARFDLILVETSGIGQGDSAIAEISDLSIYVMTPEFGAQSQLEKIDMLDSADLVVVNKFDRRGAEDALRDVRKQVRRNQKLFDGDDEALPVFGTIASQWGRHRRGRRLPLPPAEARGGDRPPRTLRTFPFPRPARHRHAGESCRPSAPATSATS
jgi:methylmalonyl-CoA mutase